MCILFCNYTDNFNDFMQIKQDLKNNKYERTLFNVLCTYHITIQFIRE